MRIIQQAEVALLLVEQDAHSALAIAERVYVMEHGRIVREGKARDLARDGVSAGSIWDYSVRRIDPGERRR